jgi:hypothetical protein
MANIPRAYTWRDVSFYSQMHIPGTSIILIFVAGLLVACSSTGSGELLESTPVPVQESEPSEVRLQAGQLSQWAQTAEASSEFASPQWSAEQATGMPDTHSCGDRQSAWASAASDSEAWLQLNYPVAVHVTQVNIIQTFNPNQVVKVELIGADERGFEIYKSNPFQVDRPCPYELSISVERTLESYDTLRITLDQSVLGLGWNEIDAVELIGE